MKLRFFNNCFFTNDDEFDHRKSTGSCKILNICVVLSYVAADGTPVWKVARYTSAAPMYFTECDEYVDGGLMANNPSYEGLKVIRDFYPNLHIALVVSLGTGKFEEQEIEEADVITCMKAFRVIEAALGLKKLIESTLQVCVLLHISSIFSMHFKALLLAFVMLCSFRLLQPTVKMKPQASHAGNFTSHTFGSTPASLRRLI